mmetsp:Transcript_32545/g.32272  ORF Transcript_32545/g.32272 Transcript_32545/m.32272 type:complete len:81 (+) Transcript_32545:13-255(+)
MIFAAIGSIVSFLGVGLSVWSYNHQDRPYSNAELTQMVKLRKTEGGKARNKKLVITIDEIQKIDPTFRPPLIPAYGEPDI